MTSKELKGVLVKLVGKVPLPFKKGSIRSPLMKKVSSFLKCLYCPSIMNSYWYIQLKWVFTYQ